jgi:AAA domain
MVGSAAMPRDSRPPWPPDEPDPRRPWIDPNPRPGKPNGLDTANPPRFQFTRFCDIKPSDDGAYVVDRLIPRLGVAVVWGKPKAGKTFWVFDLEMHISLGWPYRGRDVERGEVLHISCEAGWALGARKEAWRLHHIEGKSAAVIDTIDNASFHLCKETALDLIKDVDAVVDDIFEQFSDRQIRVITIDTLNRSLRGSESRDEDMAAYIRAATLLAEKFQCAICLIHHCGHNEDRPRGHSSLLGAVDALIQIKRDGKGFVRSTVEEMRDGPAGDTTVSRLKVIDVTEDKKGHPISSCVILDAPEGGRAATEQSVRQDAKPGGTTVL